MIGPYFDLYKVLYQQDICLKNFDICDTWHE